MINQPKPYAKKKSQTSMKESFLFENFDPSKKQCVNMEELMQFEAARQRALAQMPPDFYRNPLRDFIPHRVFINRLDVFNGSHLVKYIMEHAKEMEREEEGELSRIRGEEVESLGEEELEEGLFGEEDNESLGDDRDFKKLNYRLLYEVIGTLDFIDNPKYSRPEGILELLDQEKPDFLEKLMTCGYIIYDITSDLNCHPKQIEEAKWVAESIVKRLEEMEKNIPKAFSKLKDCRTFILISTLLTWAKTKPIDPENPKLPFTERDFRKRKPHPNYKVHCELEKRIIELGKKFPRNFRTIVIGSGIPYGHEEDILHFYFQIAWQDTSPLPIFGPGTNAIPVIHIDSLAAVIYSILESFPSKYKYIIAADPQSVTLKEMAKLLAKQLGNGKTVTVNREEAFFYPGVRQRNYDMLTSDIRVSPGYVVNNLALKWETEFPFAKNIPRLISEYKAARGLLPIKIFMHGPPASGKSFLAKRLAAHYDIPHLRIQSVIEEAMQALGEKIQVLEAKQAHGEEKGREPNEVLEEDEEEEEEGEGREEEEEESLEGLKNTLRNVEDSIDDRGRIGEEYVLKFFREKLMSNLCQNKGYVIDGYPKTMALTKALYEPLLRDRFDDEEEGEGEDGQGDATRMYNAKIMPAFVESLDASDEFLINRVIKLPQINLAHYEEHEMCRRLMEFRALNTEDNTPLIFYDELEVHPMIYNVENDLDPQMEPTFQAILHRVGPPRNYGNEGTTPGEDSDPLKHGPRHKHFEELKSQGEEVKKLAQARRDNLEKWMFLKNQELEMEEKALLVMGMPLRHYLMKYIFPTLTRGLVEVARLRPDDPVDFLSEFLFRENPEGKMFQPNYDEREEKLAEAIREYERALAARAEAKASGKSFSTEKSPLSDAVSRVTDLKCSLVSSSEKSKSARSSGKRSSVSRGTKSSSQPTSTSTEGTCTCRKSPSLSTCSSDKTSSSPPSCTCSTPESVEPGDTAEEKDVECKCPCELGGKTAGGSAKKQQHPR